MLLITVISASEAKTIQEIQSGMSERCIGGFLKREIAHWKAKITHMFTATGGRVFNPISNPFVVKPDQVSSFISGRIANALEIK
jgi:hypothetical protein